TSFLGSAELYDPATGGWSRGGPLLVARAFHSATSVLDGPPSTATTKILIVGGLSPGGMSPQAEPTAELYDAAGQTVGPTLSTPQVARAFHTATQLLNGTVLLAGGASRFSVPSGAPAGALFSAELYDPSAGTFVAVRRELAVARFDHSANLLGDGTVLVA